MAGARQKFKIRVADKPTPNECSRVTQETEMNIDLDKKKKKRKKRYSY